MKSARLIFLLVLFVGVQVLAQSDRAPFVNPANGRYTAQAAEPEQSRTFSPMQQGAAFARGTGAFKAAGTRPGASRMQVGLNFAPAVAYAAGGYDAVSVAVADVNGDGKPDLLVATCGNNSFNSTCAQEGSVGVLLGNGDGTFQPPVNYGSGGVIANSVAVADVNGDGKPDLLVANCGSGGGSCFNGTVGVLLGNGDGTFQAAVPYGSGGYNANSLAVADVNGDGKPDLLVTNDCASSSNCPGPGSVSVLLGNGDGTFQTAVSYPLAGAAWSSSVAVADVNGDGKPDLLVANACSTIPKSGYPCTSGGVVSVLLGNGDGTFQTPVPYGSGGVDAVSVAVADVNGDGKPDLLVANTCATVGQQFCTSDGLVGVLLGNGDGTFQTAVTYDSGGAGAFSVAVADVNGDGKPDLAVANYSSNDVGVLLGNGDGTFQAATIYSSAGVDDFGLAVADVNGDGKPDLLTASYAPNTSCFGSPGFSRLTPSVKGRHGLGNQNSSCLGLVSVLLNTSTFGQEINHPTGDYWPLAQGNTWVYSNATNDPNQTTTIQVLNNPTSWGCSGNAPQPNAAIEVEISKSDVNTYWYPGKTWDLHWMLGNDPLGNLMPWGWWVWDYSKQQDAGQSADVQSLTPGFPPFLILPATVSSDQDSAMLGQFSPVTTPPYPAPCVTGTGSTGTWQVSWNNATVSTPAYNGSTIQTFVNSGQGNEEDQWYFAGQIGLVEVNQDTLAGEPYTNPNPPFPPQLQLKSYSVIGL
jgi:hypothetical protein